MFYINKFSVKCAVYEIMCKNTEYIVVFPLKRLLQKRAIMLRFTCIAYLVIILKQWAYCSVRAESLNIITLVVVCKKSVGNRNVLRQAVSIKVFRGFSQSHIKLRAEVVTKIHAAVHASYAVFPNCKVSAQMRPSKHNTQPKRCSLQQPNAVTFSLSSTFTQPPKSLPIQEGWTGPAWEPS
jgi:hypothetical protein